MNNTKLLEVHAMNVGIGKQKTVILVLVIPTGKEYYLYGKTADRYLARMVQMIANIPQSPNGNN